MGKVYVNIQVNRSLSLTSWQRLTGDLKKNRELYLMVLPVIAFYILFCYKPMYGAIIAFKDFSPAKGIIESPWIGLKYFEEFFGSYYFFRVLKNTLVISINSIIFEFPIPIIFALLLNEIKNKYFVKVAQTVTYMPYFVSLVVICSLVKDFTSDTGIVSYFIELLGGERANLLHKAELFVPIYVVSEIWQKIGWSCIIYLAAISAIDQQLYEAAKIDGAGHWRQLWHVTIPGIQTTIIILFILRMGMMMTVGFEKIILLYSPLIYDTSDVISTFIYRRGIQDFNFSYSSAVGLFNSVINFTFLVFSNQLSKKFNNTSLW